jgi:hypothetical protein
LSTLFDASLLELKPRFPRLFFVLAAGLYLAHWMQIHVNGPE